MKKKISLLLIVVSTLAVLFFITCKKQSENTVSNVLTAGSWQLASILVTTTNNLSVTYDTLNTKCNNVQVLTFNADNTCTYTNFDCLLQTTTGHWSLSADDITLGMDMVVKDTTKAGSSKPFDGAQVYNAGQYSLVLQTGDYNIIPTTINKTVVTRYGFVRQSAFIK